MLAHRRLTILDLTPAAAQPMVDAVTGHVVVFNGEIYNYVELRNRLAAEGQTFQSTGDTAVMLRDVSLHGPAGRFGDFAACSHLLYGIPRNANCSWPAIRLVSSPCTSRAIRIRKANGH